MPPRPLRTTVIGSYPFPGWLEFASGRLDRFGPDDIAEMQDDAVTAALHDQLAAALDVITDGEQTRFDFNLSFYGYLQGIDLESAPPRRFGPPAHDQRGKHRITGPLTAPHGLGALEEFLRLRRLAEPLLRGRDHRPTLKASIPGPYTLAGRLIPNDRYPDRYAVTEALLPIVRDELAKLAEAGCEEITVDEPSMSCYAYREDPARLVDIFNRTVEPLITARTPASDHDDAAARTSASSPPATPGAMGERSSPMPPSASPSARTNPPPASPPRLSAHLCFGNYKGHAVGYRRYAPLIPAFLELAAREIHLEMAGREFAELPVIAEVAAAGKDVAVGVVDVKSYYIESPDDVAQRVRMCLEHVPAERLSIAPDCGLSQTARWAARRKLANMVAGVHIVRRELGLA